MEYANNEFEFGVSILLCCFITSAVEVQSTTTKSAPLFQLHRHSSLQIDSWAQLFIVKFTAVIRTINKTVADFTIAPNFASIDLLVGDDVARRPADVHLEISMMILNSVELCVWCFRVVIV